MVRDFYTALQTGDHEAIEKALQLMKRSVEPREIRGRDEIKQMQKAKAEAIKEIEPIEILRYANHEDLKKAVVLAMGLIKSHWTSPTTLMGAPRWRATS